MIRSSAGPRRETPQPTLDGLFNSPIVKEARPNPVKVERERLNAAALRVLDYLQRRRGQWVTNTELCDPAVGGNRAIGGRLKEVRDDGWEVEKRHVKGGTWEYRLMGLKGQI